MNLTTEQLAELIAGITKAQQAIIDAIDSENGGWKNTHLLPKINTAANMRFATPRLIDVPARVLMRSQGRTAMDVAGITRMLHEAMSGEPVPAVPPAKPALTIPAAYVAAPVAAAVAAGVIAATTAAPAAPDSVPAAGADDLSNFFDT